MCDPTIAKLEVREITMPYVTYMRHCEDLLELAKTYEDSEYHKQFLHEVFSINAGFPKDYYNYSAHSVYAPMSGEIERYDSHLHRFDPLIAPENYKDDCWAVLTIGKAEMIQPWLGGRYTEYFTLAMRTSIGLMSPPSNEVLECFPFKEAHIFELVPDFKTPGEGAPRYSYAKCKRVAEFLERSGSKYSTSWVPSTMEYTKKDDKYNLNVPYYASVLTDDLSVVEKLKNI